MLNLILFLIFLLHIDIFEAIQKHPTCLACANQIIDNESHLTGYLNLGVLSRWDQLLDRLLLQNGQLLFVGNRDMPHLLCGPNMGAVGCLLHCIQTSLFQSLPPQSFNPRCPPQVLACIPASLPWSHCWEVTSQIVDPVQFSVQSTNPTLQEASTVAQHRASFYNEFCRNILPSSIYSLLLNTIAQHWAMLTIECLLWVKYCLRVWEKETIIAIKAIKTCIIMDPMTSPDLPTMKYLCQLLGV